MQKYRLCFSSERDDFVVLAAYQGQPVLISFEQGKGRVILGTVPDPFTNAGLKKAGNPELVLNILALARVKGTVWFDEWHHGVQSGCRNPGTRRVPAPDSGGSRHYCLLCLSFLSCSSFRDAALAGPCRSRRRSNAAARWEHVTGIANLSRRAAHRSAVMMQYHQQIKRKLGQRYRLDPEPG